MNSRNYTLWSVMLAVLLKKAYVKVHNRKVSHDVTAAILVKQTKETVAILADQNSARGIP